MGVLPTEEEMQQVLDAIAKENGLVQGAGERAGEFLVVALEVGVLWCNAPVSTRAGSDMASIPALQRRIWRTSSMRPFSSSTTTSHLPV
jgi:uncharacterized membrane protein (UPF0182 family)